MCVEGIQGGYQDGTTGEEATRGVFESLGSGYPTLRFAEACKADVSWRGAWNNDLYSVRDIMREATGAENRGCRWDSHRNLKVIPKEVGSNDGEVGQGWTEKMATRGCDGTDHLSMW